MAEDHVAQLEAMALMLDANKIDISELDAHVADRANGTTRPTVREYVATFLAARKANTARTWRAPLRRIVDGAPALCDCLCDACLDADGGCTCGCPACARQLVSIPALGDAPVSAGTFTLSVVEASVTHAKRHAAKRARLRNQRRDPGIRQHTETGNGGAAVARDAISSLLSRALGDGYLGRNVARSVKVSRSVPRERLLTDAQLADVFRTVGTGGDDPELDTVLVWFHFETGARRGGAIALRIGDLMDSTGQLRMREKGDTDERQPVTADLLATLRAHAVARGGSRCDVDSPDYDPAAPVLYFRPRANGTVRPMTDRRYDTLFGRLQKSIPWAGDTQFTAHGLRYTGTAKVERIGGTQVARRFARHAERSDTDRYAAASTTELVSAFVEFTGEPHPLEE